MEGRSLTWDNDPDGDWAEHEVKCGITLVPVENVETESNLKKEENLVDQIGFDQSAIQDILISMEAFRG